VDDRRSKSSLGKGGNRTSVGDSDGRLEVVIILVSIGFVGISEKLEIQLFPEAIVSSDTSIIWIPGRNLELGLRELFDIKDDDSIFERFCESIISGVFFLIFGILRS